MPATGRGFTTTLLRGKYVLNSLVGYFCDVRILFGREMLSKPQPVGVRVECRSIPLHGVGRDLSIRFRTDRYQVNLLILTPMRLRFGSPFLGRGNNKLIEEFDPGSD